MIFKNLSRLNEIGANCYLVDTGTFKIVLDSGLHPKQEGAEALPAHDELEYDSVDAIILTHSHLDHTGTIPVLMKNQPRAKLYLTPPTAALADALLHNSVNVMQSKREELGILEYPLYGHRELDTLQERWEHLDYNCRLKLADDVHITFYNAGHVLGSCGVLVEANDHRLFYTGDIQFTDQCLIKGAEFPTQGVDTLVVETTRGAAPRRADYTRPQEEEAFCEAIKSALQKGGSVLVPVFAMGKTQEVLAMIHRFKSEGKLPEKTPVFIGGLSTKMTLIFDDFGDTMYRSDEDFHIIEDMGLKISSKKKKRKPIVYQKQAIFALSSGMMTEKTVSNQFARTFINNPKNSLLFVGYADPLSPGGILKEAEQGDRITLDPNENDVLFDCTRENFDFSGHSTRDEIFEYIEKLSPKTAFLVHGDLDASQWFSDKIKDTLPATTPIIPAPRKDYPLQ